jgi:hypothetical protein
LPRLDIASRPSTSTRCNSVTPSREPRADRCELVSPSVCSHSVAIRQSSLDGVGDFLNLSHPAEQVEYWDRRLDSKAWRVAVDRLLAPRLLGIGYASPFVESLPRDFGPRLRQRLRRTWATHPNRSNPHAASLFLGRPPVEPNVLIFQFNSSAPTRQIFWNVAYRQHSEGSHCSILATEPRPIICGACGSL